MDTHHFITIPTNEIDKSRINTTVEAGGRFGNKFIRNIISSFIAKKNNLVFSYDSFQEMYDLGIILFTEGTNIYDNTLIMNDQIIDYILFDETYYNTYLYNNNIFYKQHDYSPFHFQNHTWAQTNKIANYIKYFLYNNKDNIISKNKYKHRYQSNNSVFIHIRLGDTVELGFSTKYEYYDKVLSSLPFDKGFISSDTIEHDTCQRLIEKYGLEIYNDNEINTIQFASTNKYIILSNGTFSWTIGALSFFSNIYYPKLKNWPMHGDIYVFEEWTEIDF